METLQPLISGDEWRKRAAASAAQTTEDIEKAFLDQAYIQIQNKATPLMRPPYRVGFEIVHRNDDNTRMVGIFVFRVSRDLFYAPVFFINGSIKGTDLFYRVTPKKFVPLTNNWVEFLMGLADTSEGRGVPMRERQNTRKQLNFHQVVEPPLNYKMASTEETRQLAREAWEGIQAWVNELPAKMASLDGGALLRQFITEDGGYNAMQKIANTAKASYDFANALFLGSKAENYSPDLPAVKQASTEPEVLLTLHTNVLANANCKSASETQIAKGYAFEDLRKEAQVNEAVFEDNTRELTGVSEPGVYDVMLADGSTRKMVCGYASENSMRRKSIGGCDCVGSTISPGTRGPTQRRRVFVSLEDGRPSDSAYADQKVFGKPLLEEKITSHCTQSPETGKAYRVYCESDHSLSEQFYITGKSKNSAGLTELEVAFSYTDSPSEKLTINPDYDGCDYNENVFGKCCHFIEVGCEKPSEGHYLRYNSSIRFGDKYAIDAFIFDQGYKRASLRKLPHGYFIFREHDGKPFTPELSKLAAIIHVMGKCHLREETAEDIVKKAEAKIDCDFGFYYDQPKEAMNIRFPNFPEFPDVTNDEFMTAQGNPDTLRILKTEADRPNPTNHRIGDMFSQETGQTIDTMTPMDLYGLSQERGMGALFEHGVVGELVKTYDSAALIDKHMPKLEDALDVMGRLLFLFYWKPEDYAKSYGSDDQSQLESKLLSCFKSYGDLVLELLQKNRNAQQGSVSLA